MAGPKSYSGTKPESSKRVETMAGPESYSGTKPESSKCGTKRGTKRRSKRRSVGLGSGKRQRRGTLAELGRGKSVEGQSPGKLAELRREDDDDDNSDVTEEDIQAVLLEAKMDKLRVEEGRYFCEVCLKEGNHYDGDCPYFVSIPKGAKIGSGYDIVCVSCGEDHQNDSDDDAGVLGEDWQARAILKICTFCGGKSGHWHDECPVRKKR